MSVYGVNVYDQKAESLSAQKHKLPVQCLVSVKCDIIIFSLEIICSGQYKDYFYGHASKIKVAFL